ncbi:hypothetical protein ACRAWF_47030 [Streptomyces sp. L7]
MLAEIDFGGIAAYVNQLLDMIRTKVTAYLGAAVGAAVGASAGMLGILIGMAVGAAVGWAFDQLKGIVEDDVFAPATLSTIIPALTGRWSGQKPRKRQLHPPTTAASAGTAPSDLHLAARMFS